MSTNFNIIDTLDDKIKNGVKTYTWGLSFWTMLHYTASDLNNSDDNFVYFVRFLFLSPKDILPCMYCRNSFRKYIKSPDYQIENYIRARKLPDFVYLIHNEVNRKLGKNQPGSAILFNYGHTYQPHREKEYALHFWIWVQSIAFNFPAEIEFLDYWNKQNDTPFRKWAFGTEAAKDLRMRLKTYILFFDMLKHFLYRDSEIYRLWTYHYMLNTPTMMTFSSRTQLLRWLFNMQKLSGYGSGSFVQMLESLHPTRSTPT